MSILAALAAVGVGLSGTFGVSAARGKGAAIIPTQAI